MNFLRESPSEQDIASMLSNLEEAHKYNGEAKKAYLAQDYRNAAQNYHRCMLYAKAVVQLTSTDLREMARAQMLLSASEKAGGEGESGSSFVDTAVEKELGHDVIETAAPNHSRNRLDSTTRGQEIGQEAKELMTKCYNNLAACLLARETNTNEDYMRAVFYCDNVLKVEPDNEKALFRKGVALMRAQKWDKAIELFGRCRSNAQARLYTIDCQRSVEEDRRRREAEIRANFAKAREAEAAAQAVQANGHHNVQPEGPAPTMNGHVQHQ